MDIVSELLEKNKMSKYGLSKMSGVPYSTLSDICSGKTDIKKVSAETLVRIAHVFKVKPEELVGTLEYPAAEEKKKKSAKNQKVNISKETKKPNNEKKEENTAIEVDITFKAGIMKKIDVMGELGFLVSTIKTNTVVNLYENNQKKESKFLLTLVDSLCNKYNFPICKEYEYIRKENN